MYAGEISYEWIQTLNQYQNPKPSENGSLIAAGVSFAWNETLHHHYDSSRNSTRCEVTGIGSRWDLSFVDVVVGDDVDTVFVVLHESVNPTSPLSK